MSNRHNLIDRRSFLGSATIGSSALLAALAGRLTEGATTSVLRGSDYGPLSPAFDRRDGVARLALPAGFEYRSFGWEGDIMSDGLLTPRAHDGMAAFATRNGRVRLVRNHEDRDVPPESVVKGDPELAYDRKAGGGTTTLEVKLTPAGDRVLVRDFLSLSGTTVNCAGGPTPWGSWLTCEETLDDEKQGFQRRHGYVFDVPATADGQVKAEPHTALGRFAHEAVAVDPLSSVIYETEDANPCGFYGFLPRRPGRLDNGRLMMLAVRNQPNYDTRTGQTVGEALPVEWVGIEQPDPAPGTSVFDQGYAKGGAAFTRLEGVSWGRRSAFIVSTDGGDAQLGQVWEYRPDAQGGTLTLTFESPAIGVLSGPDNLTVSPRGGILLCEDGNADVQYLRGLDREGQVFDFALNLVNEREFAGACFATFGNDDDGDGQSRSQTLFVNIQGDTRTSDPTEYIAYTFAIWGPWHRGAL